MTLSRTYNYALPLIASEGYPAPVYWSVPARTRMIKVGMTWLIFCVLLASLQACVYKPAFTGKPGALQGSSSAHDIWSLKSDLFARAHLPLKAPGLERLPEPELERTPEVEREIRLMRKGYSMRHALQRRAKYHRLVSEIFVDEGVPLAISNLALIESGYNHAARSPAGAVGLWQLTSGTARRYGLKISPKQDDRLDPILSSIAAARHLRDLYVIYKDWHFALAAYNAGSYGLDKALSRARSRNFWELARSGQIRSETARFVPKFIAASLLVKEMGAMDASQTIG